MKYFRPKLSVSESIQHIIITMINDKSNSMSSPSVVLSKEPNKKLYADSLISSSTEFGSNSNFSSSGSRPKTQKIKRNKSRSSQPSLSSNLHNTSSQSENSNYSSSGASGSNGCSTFNDESEEFLIVSKPAYNGHFYNSGSAISSRSISPQTVEVNNSSSLSHRSKIKNNNQDEANQTSSKKRTCCVCKNQITQTDFIKHGDQTPYPEKVHGHCWLHITNKNCPIPWPRNLPREHINSQRNLNKSEQLPTIRKMQKFYNFMTTGNWEVAGESDKFNRSSIDKRSNNGKGMAFDV